MPEDYTRVMEPQGSWENHQVAERNRMRTYLPAPENFRVEKRRPHFYLTRITAVIVMIPLLMVLVLSASLANWAQKTIVEDSGFELVTSQMANDVTLQDQLKTAVVEDIMANSAITSVVGDGSAEGVFGSVQNWAHDQLQNTISSTVSSVFSSADFPQIWQQVMDASHTYNMNNPDVAGIDIAPIFNAVDAQIGTVLGYDPDLTKSTFIVPLESASNNVVAQNLGVLKNFGATWQALMIVTIIFAVLMFVVAPTRRLWWAGWTAALSSLAVWIVSLMVGYFTLPDFGSETAKVFVTGLTDAFKTSLSSHLFGVATGLLIAAVIAFLLAFIIMLVKVFTGGANSRIKGILNGLA